MGKRWYYFGDVNPENGGMLIRLSEPEYGLADCVRITPCADAGGPANMFWIEALSVFGMDEPAKREEVSKACGWELNISTFPTEREHAALAEAFASHGFCDPANCYPHAQSEVVQIGPDDKAYGGFEKITPTRRLRANTNVMRYMRKFAEERF